MFFSKSQRRRSRSRSRSRQPFRNTRPCEQNQAAAALALYQQQENAVQVEEMKELMEDLMAKEGQNNGAWVPIPQNIVVPYAPTRSRSLSDIDFPVKELAFNVQLAHGSPTIKVTDFSSIGGLFDQIVNGLSIKRDDIIFCTINNHKVDMNNLFTGSLDVTDMLFVHVRGQPVEVEMTKTDVALGVTIADNGLCRSFIKRIREGSVAEATKPALCVGQLIEQIEGHGVLGLRHYEVAKVLRGIPVGKKFTMRLINPLTSGFSFLQPRGGAAAAKKPVGGSGMGTVRFKADGGVVVQAEAPNKEVISKLNELFDSYLGVQDDELAQTIWDAAAKCNTLQDMIDTVRNSELNMFDFPDELVFDMWGIVSDLKRKAEKAKTTKNPFLHN